MTSDIQATKPTRRPTIFSLGTSLPVHSIPQNDAAQLACDLGITKRWLKALPTLYRSSGVEKRHSVLLEPEILESVLPDSSLANDHTLVPVTSRQSFYPASTETPLGPTTRQRMAAYEQHAGELAYRSAASAIQHASENQGIHSEAITHLVTVSCSGFTAPGVDLHLIQSLGLNPEIQRTHVGFMGCHGALNGMRVAKAIVEADPAAVVLLCAVELCSLHQQYTDDAQQLVANSLFADGSASLIIGSKLHADLPDSWVLKDQGSLVIPDSQGMMSWKIADHGFEMSLSPKVPTVIEEHLRPWLIRFLNRNHLSPSEVHSWAIHPGGPRILASCKEAIPLTPNQIQWSEKILATCGNMSSPTVLFILDSISRQTEAKNCMMLAFGPGLCIEGALLTRGDGHQSIS